MLRSNSGFPARTERPAVVAVHNIINWGDMPCVANRCAIAAEFAAKSTATNRCILHINGPAGLYVKEITTAGAWAFLSDLKDIAWLMHRLARLDKLDWPQHLRVWRREHRHVALRAEYDKFVRGLADVRRWLEDDAKTVLWCHNAEVAAMVRGSVEMKAVRS